MWHRSEPSRAALRGNGDGLLRKNTLHATPLECHQSSNRPQPIEQQREHPLSEENLETQSQRDCLILLPIDTHTSCSALAGLLIRPHKKNRLTNQYTLARILATAISFFCGSKHIFEFLHLADEALIPSCTRLKKKKKKFPPPATRLPRAGNSESHDVPGSWP